jgi:putative ABC transport system substrate-binding protein
MFAGANMKRREFIALFGGLAASRPLVARAQPAPVIGFLTSRTSSQAEYLVTAIRDGLKQAGFIEGQNMTIEYRYAENEYDRLPALAADLVNRHVSAIIAGGTMKPVIAQTKTIPIVFTTGFDPVATGVVTSLNRPDANVTGATFYSGALSGKQMELLIELAPKTAIFGLLVNPTSTGVTMLIRDAQTAASATGRKLEVLNAATVAEIDAALTKLATLSNAALLVGVDPFFDSHAAECVDLAARHRVPTAYYLSDFTRLGGLVGYGASITDTYRQAGNYAGRILKGEKPSDLPIQLPTKFELSINLKTAKALGLDVPPKILALADQVIE